MTLAEFLKEESDRTLADEREDKRGMGNLYDHNSYGAGYSAGYAAALKAVIDFTATPAE